jgi:hypothetical protein
MSFTTNFIQILFQMSRIKFPQGQNIHGFTDKSKLVLLKTKIYDIDTFNLKQDGKICNIICSKMLF